MNWLNLVLIWLVIFLIRFQTGFQSIQNLDRFSGKPVLLTGRISSQIKLQDSSQSFSLGLIQVKTKLYPAYQYGDKVTISGTLQRKVINPWYIRFSLMYPGINKLESGNSFFIGLKQ